MILVLVISVYILSLLVLSVYSLVAIWPANPATFANSTAPSSVRFLTARYTLPSETWVLLIVIVAGVIGSLIHSAWNLGAFLGKREFKASWTLWYLAHPFVGAGLAVLIYFALRAGLLSSGTTAGNLNLFGIAAISGLAGMFTREAMAKLKDMADNLFAKAKPKTPPQG